MCCIELMSPTYFITIMKDNIGIPYKMMVMVYKNILCLTSNSRINFLSADYILICHFLGLLLGNSWPIEKVEDQLS